MSAKWWWLTFLASSLLFGLALIITGVCLIADWPMTVAHYSIAVVAFIAYGSTLLWVLRLATKENGNE